MKDKLLGTLGVFGFILWYALVALFVIIPVAAADFPWFVNIIIFALLYFTDFIGAFLTVAIYIYSTFIVLSGPLNWFAVIYFIDLLLYIIFFFIPTAANIVSIFRENHRSF